MIQPIRIKRRHSFGDTTPDGRMFLQRRGISAQREYGNAEHGFFVIAFPNGGFEVSFKKDTICISPKDGQAAVEALIAERTGAQLRFGKETMAYCYASAGTQLEQPDLFFSPLRYEPGSDTVRHIPTNYCVVAFQEGRFATPILDLDRAASSMRPAVEKALRQGFHSCDTRLGDDHCKRRLAWLAGCYLLEGMEAGDEMLVGVLGRDMSSAMRIDVPH